MLDRNRTYQQVYGDSPCRWKQDGKYYDGPGNEMTPEQVAMSSEAYIASKGNGAQEQKAESPVSSTKDEYEIELKQYTSHALKRLMKSLELIPQKGMGSTALNIALLLDHKFPEGV